MSRKFRIKGFSECPDEANTYVYPANSKIPQIPVQTNYSILKD